MDTKEIAATEPKDIEEISADLLALPKAAGARRARGPGDVLLSKFVLAQAAFNMFASFCGPLIFFYLIFVVLLGGPFDWNSGPALGVGLASPIASAVLALAFASMEMPAAVDSGWLPTLAMSDRGCAAALPFLGRGSWLRVGVARNAMLGLCAEVLLVPIYFLVLRFALGPSMSAWTFVLASVTYIGVVIPLFVVPLGILGYALEPNFERVRATMADDVERSCIGVLLRKAWRSPLC